MEVPAPSTQKGKSQFMDHDGYLYQFERIGSKGKEIWICSRRNVCKARVHVESGEVTAKVNEHSHAPDPAEVEVRGLKRRMSEKAETTRDNPGTIIGEVLASASDSAISLLARKEHIRRTLRAKRRNIHGLPEELDDEEFDIPDSIGTIKTDREEEPFLKWDGRTPSGKRILIFSTNKQLENLNNATSIFCDGTFSTCPSVG